MLELKRITSPENPAVTSCRASESITAFYLLGCASGQGFGSGLWDHEGMIYDFGKLVDTMEKRDLQMGGGNQSHCQSRGASRLTSYTMGSSLYWHITRCLRDSFTRGHYNY